MRRRATKKLVKNRIETASELINAAVRIDDVPHGNYMVQSSAGERHWPMSVCAAGTSVRCRGSRGTRGSPGSLCRKDLGAGYLPLSWLRSILALVRGSLKPILDRMLQMVMHFLMYRAVFVADDQRVYVAISQD
jgi:hypothetical protein